MYCNGNKSGFKQFQSSVRTLKSTYGEQTQWMKLSEIARYWAAKSWTRFKLDSDKLRIEAPISCANFTFQCDVDPGKLIAIHEDGSKLEFNEVRNKSQLHSGSWFESDQGLILCMNLPKGQSQIQYQDDK
ncbi:MAG: hypothetical protein U0930_24950 [Pirellulales bacterium]